MKVSGKFLSVLFAVVLLSSYSLTAATVVGNTESDMGKYWLKKAASPMVVNGNEVQTYVIHYDKLNAPVYVGVVKPNEKCTDFIVRTDGFEVLYTCKQGVFGIEYLPRKYATLPLHVAKNAIDRQHFLYQRIITKTPQAQEDLLALIACYLPEVMS